MIQVGDVQIKIINGVIEEHSLTQEEVNELNALLEAEKLDENAPISAEELGAMVEEIL